MNPLALIHHLYGAIGRLETAIPLFAPQAAQKNGQIKQTFDTRGESGGKVRKQLRKNGVHDGDTKTLTFVALVRQLPGSLQLP